MAGTGSMNFMKSWKILDMEELAPFTRLESVNNLWEVLREALREEILGDDGSQKRSSGQTNLCNQGNK
jgi:hypothetical protein